MLLPAGPKEVAHCNNAVICNNYFLCDILTPSEQPTAPFATVHVQCPVAVDVRARCAASPEMPVYVLNAALL